MQQGVVFDISPFMLEDGPGIRSNVFVKGCCLRCQWCSNVYGLESQIQLSYDQTRCIGCGACLTSCAQGAISVQKETGLVQTDFQKCKNCMACVSVCRAKARRQIGRYYTAEEIVREVEKDRMYYRRSQGGITMSGGEILMQPEFTAEVLERCSKLGINTAIETSGCGKWEAFSRILKYCDTVFIDCKCMDAAKHKQLTGVDHALILENIRRAAEQCVSQGTELIVRLPLIPTMNDDTENILQTAAFVKTLAGQPLLNILPYHNYGSAKYPLLGREYQLKNLKMQTAEELQKVKELLEKEQIRFSIGGYDI